MLVILGAQQVLPIQPPGTAAAFFGMAVPGRAPGEWSHACVLSTTDPTGDLEPILASERREPQHPSFFVAEALAPALGTVARPGSPPRARSLVFSNAVAGREEEFNSWYSDRHVHDVLKTPGYLTAQRFRLLDHPRLRPSPWRYLAIYEIALGWYEAAVAETAGRSGTPLMPISEAAQRPMSAHYTPQV